MVASAKPDKPDPVPDSTAPALIVFGCDPQGKPLAATFTASQSARATQAAESMSLRALTIGTDPVRKLAATLPRGRIAGEKAIVPRVKPSLYANLVAFAGGGAPSLKLVAGADAQGSGSKDKGAADLEHRPSAWGEIRAGSIVLAEDVPKEGWYESVVREVMAEGLFKLTWQFWPGEAAFVRKVGQLALLPPKK